MSDPTTEAGRKLLAWRPYHDACALNLGTKEHPAAQAIEDCDCHLTSEVAAVESAARAEGIEQERRRWMPAYATLRDQHSVDRCGNGCPIARLLDELADPEPEGAEDG